MKKIIGLWLVLLMSNNAQSQNLSNYLQIITNSLINFTLFSPSNIESPQTIQNAIIVRVASKSSNCSVYAKLSSTIYPYGFSAPTGFIKIDWTYDNSNKDYNLITGPVSLDNTDKLLFNQKKMSNNTSYYDYYYDFILTPPAYATVPGIYSFTLLFTMTQP